MNEITVSRKDTTSMITIDTYLNEEYLNSYWADGLIFQPQQDLQDTLSCGGPILTPDVKASLLHLLPLTILLRPLVVPDETEIRLKVSGRDEYYLVSLDSRVTSVRNESVLTLKKTPFKLIWSKFEKPFENTRSKLLWRQED
jgi:NAD+ kinase